MTPANPSSPGAAAAIAPAGTHPGGRAGHGPAPGRTRPRGRRAAGRDDLRDLVEAFAQLYLEVEAGQRPAAQLAPLLDLRLALQLEGVWVRLGSCARLRSVTVRRTSADAYEAVALLDRGQHVGALALRLERRDGRLVVVAADRPEDGRLPEPEHAIPDDHLDAFALVEADCGDDEVADLDAPGGVALHASLA